MDDEKNYFSIVDYVLFSLCLLVSAFIGLFYACTGGKQRTTEEFLMADHNMKVFPVAMSLLASFMSAITLLGTPSEVYVNGTLYMLIGFSYIIHIPLAAHIYIPMFYKLNVTSAYEYLEMRFSRGVRLTGSLTFILQMVLYMAIVLYAPALALNAVTGLNVWVSVLSVGVVCTFYTTLGGIKAVMWTDVFQILMMFAGLLAVLIQGSIEEGGFANIWEVAYNDSRVEFLNFDPNPGVRHTAWSLVIGGAFTWLAVYGVNQAQVQRAMTCPKLKKAQIAMWINLPGLIALMILTSLAGLTIYANYRNCDPLTKKDILSADQLLPLFVMEKLSFLTGLPGLFVACIFSGALSTVSSGLNSLAAITLQDVVKGYIKPNLPDQRATVVAKILAMSYGVICIALTFVAAQMGGVLQAALGLFGIIGGPLLGLFTLGMFFPWANWKGAYAGHFTSLIMMLWIGVGAQIYKPIEPKPPVSILGCNYGNTSFSNMTTVFTNYTTTLAPSVEEERPALAALYTLSYMWYSATAVLIVVVIGLLVSFITGPTNPRDVDPRLICPLVDKFCCCLPDSFLQKFRCGIDHTNKYDVKEDEEKPQEVDAANRKVGQDNPGYKNSEGPVELTRVVLQNTDL